MTDWRPSSGPDAARRRAEMLARARAYFATKDVLEVDTPSLSPAAGSDPHIENFTVDALAGKRLYLHSSPEFCMKRLLAAGYPDIFSIARVFRDGEAGPLHLPEFTLLEWYRKNFGLAEITADTTAMIAACLHDSLLEANCVTLDYRDAFLQFAGIDALSADIADLAACANADARLRAAIGNDRDAWLDLLLDTAVAPRFDRHRLTVLMHFPASKASLARLCPADPEVADRFEVFMGSVELANGFVELTDAAEQRARIEGELEIRRTRGQPVGPVDDEFLSALESGLPDCAGVAVGFERLQMTLDHAGDIGDVVTFRQE